MNKYHLIGIKGSGMSALAILLKRSGNYVQGSDVEEYLFTEKELRNNSIEIFNFSEMNIKDDLIIVSSDAFNETNNIECKYAIENNIKLYKLQDILGELTKTISKKSIIVAGAHGKTSTTNMVKEMLKEEYKTAFFVGDGTGIAFDENEYFVLEGNEYRNHFHKYYGKYAIVLNIDFDHPDFFKDLKDMQNQFSIFSENIERLIVCGDDEKNKNINWISKEVYYYGLEEHNDFYPMNIIQDQNGVIFDLYFREELIIKCELPFFGDNYLRNAISALSISYLEDNNMKKAISGLKKMKLPNRRFEIHEKNGYTIIDDFAHHPEEIKSVLQMAKQKYPHHKICGVHQPYTASRTSEFINEFADSMGQFDVAYITELQASAREKEVKGLDIKLTKLIDNGHFLDFNDLSVLREYKDNWIIIFMSCGDIHKYVLKLLSII